jgi:tetratricopeptide (TPR) repeat protein
MSTPSHRRDPLRLDDVLPRLPDVENIRPVLDQLIATSQPDPARRWSGSGELGTAGGRLVDLDALRDGLAEVAASEARKVARRFEAVAALTHALARGKTGEAVRLLLDESGVLEAEGAAADAGAWAGAAARIAAEAGDQRCVEAIRRAARCARALGALGEAADGYERAFERARAVGGVDDAVIAATGRGNIAVDRGRWEVAEVWYRRGLSLLDSTEVDSLPPVEVRALRWRIYQNLGITSRERGALHDSATWYARAEDESAGLDDPAVQIEVQNGRGQLDLARGDLRKAELRFRKALETLDAVRPSADDVRVAVNTNLGEALLGQGRALEAGQVARDAEAEALRGRFFGRLPAAYRLLARVVDAQGEPEAFVVLDQALAFVRAHGLPRYEEARTLQAYAELRAARGDEESAHDARIQAESILSSLETHDES